MVGRFNNQQKETAVNAHDSTTIGLDLGNTFNKAVGLDAGGNVVLREDLRNDAATMKAFFEAHRGATVAMETGTHCRWIAALAAECGCHPVVGNARKLRLISESSRKNDWADAQKLARLCRSDRSLLHPVELHDDRHHRLYQLLRQRDALVSMRTALVNQLRGFAKAGGTMLPRCDARSFLSLRDSMPPEFLRDFKPLLKTLEDLAKRIAAAEAILAEFVRRHFRKTDELLQTVPGVGPVASAAFIALVPDPGRFKSAREAGPYFGLVPKQDQSGDGDRPCRITHEGSSFMRKTLVNAANALLRKSARDTALKRFGERLGRRGQGKVVRRKAKVALARKLAVTMLAMARSGEDYRDAPAPEPAEATGLASVRSGRASRCRKA